MQKSPRRIAAPTTRPGRTPRPGSCLTSSWSEVKPNMLVGIPISLEGGGRSFVGLLLLFVPRPGAASTAWDLKSVVANLGKEAAFQSDVFHSPKCRSTEWTNLFNKNRDNFCLMALCILPDSFLGAVGHWKVFFGCICRSGSHPSVQSTLKS